MHVEEPGDQRLQRKATCLGVRHRGQLVERETKRLNVLIERASTSLGEGRGGRCRRTRFVILRDRPLSLNHPLNFVERGLRRTDLLGRVIQSCKMRKGRIVVSQGQKGANGHSLEPRFLHLQPSNDLSGLLTLREALSLDALDHLRAGCEQALDHAGEVSLEPLEGGEGLAQGVIRLRMQTLGGIPGHGITVALADGKNPLCIAPPYQNVA